MAFARLAARVSYAIGLVVHSGRAAAVAAAETVHHWAEQHGVRCTEIVVWGADDGATRYHASEEAERAGHPDLIVTVGGDGTLLRGVRVAAPIGGLVLGVNVGRVGFLTEVAPDDLITALDAIHAGRYRVDARLTLTMRASRPLEIPAGMDARCDTAVALHCHRRRFGRELPSRRGGAYRWMCSRSTTSLSRSLPVTGRRALRSMSAGGCSRPTRPTR